MRDTAMLIIGASIAWTALVWTRRPFSLAMLLVLLPVYQIRFDIFGIPSTLLELFIVILVLVWLIDTIRKHAKITFPHAWIVLAVLVAGTIATVVSADVRAGLGLWKAYIIEPVLVYLVCINTWQSKKDIRRMLWAIILLVGIVAGGAIMQKIGWLEIPEPYASEIPQRATSVYLFPTAIGKILGSLISFCIVFLLYARSALNAGFRKRFIGFSLATCLGLVALYFSVNRGALLGVLVAVVVAMMFTKRKILVLSLVGGVLCVLLLLPIVQNEIQSVFTRQDTSTDVRIVLWQGTWRLITHHPITGAGLGGFPTLYDSYRDASHVELFPNPDNLYLTLWAELGIYGLMAFVGLFAVWIRESILVIRESLQGSSEWLVGVALSSSLVAILVHGLVDTPYFKNDLAVLFWILFALLVANRSHMQEK